MGSPVGGILGHGKRGSSNRSGAICLLGNSICWTFRPFLGVWDQNCHELLLTLSGPFAPGWVTDIEIQLVVTHESIRIWGSEHNSVSRAGKSRGFCISQGEKQIAEILSSKCRIEILQDFGACSVNLCSTPSD